MACRITQFSDSIALVVHKGELDTANKTFAAVKEKAEADAALHAALESRKQKEKKAKSAKVLFDKENKRRQPGTLTGKGKRSVISGLRMQVKS